MSDGVFQSRGHIEASKPMLRFDENDGGEGERVVLRYETNQKCATDTSFNVSSEIVFTCPQDSTVPVCWSHVFFLESCLNKLDKTTLEKFALLSSAKKRREHFDAFCLQKLLL